MGQVLFWAYQASVCPSLKMVPFTLSKDQNVPHQPLNSPLHFWPSKVKDQGQGRDNHRNARPKIVFLPELRRKCCDIRHVKTRMFLIQSLCIAPLHLGGWKVREKGRKMPKSFLVVKPHRKSATVLFTLIEGQNVQIPGLVCLLRLALQIFVFLWMLSPVYCQL